MPMRITLFNTERVDGSVSGVDESMRFSGLHQISVDGDGNIVGNMKFPSKFTNKTDAKGQNLSSYLIRLLQHSIWSK